MNFQNQMSIQSGTSYQGVQSSQSQQLGAQEAYPPGSVQAEIANLREQVETLKSRVMEQHQMIDKVLCPEMKVDSKEGGTAPEPVRSTVAGQVHEIAVTVKAISDQVWRITNRIGL